MPPAPSIRRGQVSALTGPISGTFHLVAAGGHRTPFPAETAGAVDEDLVALGTLALLQQARVGPAEEVDGGPGDGGKRLRGGGLDVPASGGELGSHGGGA